MAHNPEHHPRRIVVDDTNEAIKYDGSWFVQQGNYPNRGNFGAPLDHTLHGVESEGVGSLSYSYQGSSFAVYGSIAPNSSAQWECVIDAESIGRQGYSPIEFGLNRWKLCEWNTNDYANHTLIINARSTGATFLFDYISFVPSPEFSARDTKTVVEIPYNDPEARVKGEWTDLGSFGRMTKSPRASLTIDFYGTAIEWWGFAPQEQPHEPSMASYAIDNVPGDTKFTIPGRRRREVTQYNQMFFRTPNLELANHTITVTYLGAEAPLTLNYFHVDSQEREPGTLGVNSITGTAGPSTPTMDSSDSNSDPLGAQAKPAIGPIVGGIVGTLAFIALIAGLFFFWRKRQQKKTLPMITPLPGFQKPQTAAPLDIDLVSTRLSDEFYQHRPGSYGSHARRRSTPRTPVRRFNPEIVNSIELNPPVVQHAPPTTTNTGRDNDSHRSRDTDSVNIAEVPRTPRLSSHTNSQLNPYEAGYPYGGMQLAEYQRLVEATKSAEARAQATRPRDSYM